jgi:hypothetical protein
MSCVLLSLVLLDHLIDHLGAERTLVLENLHDHGQPSIRTRITSAPSFRFTRRSCIAATANKLAT